MARIILLAVLALAAVGGTAALYLALKPEPPPATTAPPAAAPDPRVVELVVRDGQRIAGPDRIELRQDELLTLRVSSDSADELHLHGYDLHLHLRPGEPAELTFRAVHTGRFEYELHKTHLPLGSLEVLPR